MKRTAKCSSTSDTRRGSRSGREALPQVVVGGFHLMRKTGYGEIDLAEQDEIARSLAGYPCRFYICHCTGEEPYVRMRAIMGDKLRYLRTGGVIEL